MDEDLEKTLREFDFSIPFNVFPEVFVRLIRAESRLEAIYSLFPQVSAGALHKDEEYCENRLDEVEQEIFNEKMTEFIGRFGEVSDRPDATQDPS